MNNGKSEEYRFGDETKLLREILEDPVIRPVAADAIRKMDISREAMWNKSLLTLKEEHFGGGLARGFDRLFRAAETGEWYYPLYSREECAEEPDREGTNLVFFPSEAPEAGSRPYIFLVPGGGFVNVWNLTEGWPVAAQFNDLGYHVFILTYQVAAKDRVLEREMEDFARAFRLIRENGKKFGVRPDRYITCGFSAGGYLVCLWNVPEKGYAHHGLPKPQATFPVYPVVSWQLSIREGWYDQDEAEELFGTDIETAASGAFEIPGHTAQFPPCAVFLAAGDTLVNPEHSRRLAKSLEKDGIPCRLEIGPEGGHGFADGSGMCMEGWTKRAVSWYETEIAPGAPAGLKTIYLAGGCFWGCQKYFDQFEGVRETETGYANGPDRPVTYEDVCGNSGHAETVKVVYDETVISLRRLLEYYFMVIDPLSVNRQGHDTGIQYRTGVYYVTEDQLPVIREVFAEEEKKAGAKLAVEAEALRNFFPAEAYHQKYLDKNPGGYCHIPAAMLNLKRG